MKKLIRMDSLIQRRSTGTPQEFAKKLELSRSTLFEYLAYMRQDLEVGILYDRYRGTYYYEGENLYETLMGNAR